MTLKNDIEVLIGQNNRYDWNYFGISIHNLNPLDEPIQFISEMFMYAQKHMLNFEYKCNGQEIFEQNYRAAHSVSTFFIGILIAEKITEIDKFKITLSDPENEFPFSYLWSLTCLFHDRGYCFERDIQLADEIKNTTMPDTYLRNTRHSYLKRQRTYKVKLLKEKMNVNCSIWYGPYSNNLTEEQKHKFERNAIDRQQIKNHNELIRNYYRKNKKKFVFDGGMHLKYPSYKSEIITNYFNYRLDQNNECDHGIAGGFLFYDLIIKNYKAAYFKENEQVGSINFENFVHCGRRFCLEQIPVFAYIADCIISHNIWCTEEGTCHAEKYQQSGLESLIGKNYCKIKFNDNPILFILAIADTIDPIKTFASSNNQITSNQILEYVEIEANKSCLEIHVDTRILDTKQYFDKICQLKDWVDIEISIQDQNFIKIIFDAQKI